MISIFDQCKCGKIKQKYSKLCRSCYLPTMKGKTSPRFKGLKTDHICEQCGVTYRAYIKRKSRYCSEKCYGKFTSINRRGEKIYNYIKDRTQLATTRNPRGDSTESIAWSREVKRRDGWVCKISNEDCFGNLEAHHILPVRSHPELRYKLNNGITLCHFHHPRKRNDVERLIPIFRDMVEVI